MRPKMCQLWVQIPVLLGLMSDGFDFQPNHQTNSFSLPPIRFSGVIRVEVQSLLQSSTFQRGW